MKELAQRFIVKFSAFKHADELYDALERKEKEAQYWKSKFDRIWSAWHKLAVEAKGPEEAAKMSEALKKGDK